MVCIITTILGFCTGFMFAALFPPKSDYERRIDDEEQMKYLAEYNKKKQQRSKDKNEW